MIDNILVEDLADSPPQLWNKRIRQAAVLRRFDGPSRPSPGQVDKAASELNIKRRQLYALLGARRQRLSGTPALGHGTGRHYHIGLAQEQVIADAIANAGAGARLVAVHREAERLSRTRGTEPPSRTAVRTRFCKGAGVVDLAERLVSECDLIADLGELELAICRGGEAVPVHLLAVLDPRSSIVLDHQLYAGRPTVEQFRSWMQSLLADRAIPGMPATAVGLPCSLLHELRDGSVASEQWQLVPTSTRRNLPEGAALHAAFGGRIGRIALRSRPSVPGWPTASDSVPGGAANLVIGYIISCRNDDLERELMWRSKREARFNCHEDRGEQMLKVIDDVHQAPAFG